MLVKLNELIKNVRSHYENYEFAAIYHAINNFFTVDMSSFYLDFAKDVLYIEAEDQSERRAIQTVLYETLTALAKLLSPILPHTADEVWAEVPGATEQYVQLTDMPEYKEIADAASLTAKWTAFMNVRDDVLKALEKARNEKVIGKSLTAHVRLYADSDVTDLLASIQEDLKQLFIVSGFEVAGSKADAPDNAVKLDTASVVVGKASGETCERCWTVTEEVGQDPAYSTLCPRCAEVVAEHYPELN
jgi:isoleucyl-tRNA synthetase